jgi:hypothetical protein
MRSSLLLFYKILARSFVFYLLRSVDYFSFEYMLLLITGTSSRIDQAMTSAMTSLEQNLPPMRRCVSRPEFHAWLARARPGEQLEYHRGHLIWDRSPTSDLAEDERRALAKVADAALQAAEDGFAHLVQRRNGPLDFSYLAVRSSRRAGAAPAASPPQIPAAA